MSHACVLLQERVGGVRIDQPDEVVGSLEELEVVAVEHVAHCVVHTEAGAKAVRGEVVIVGAVDVEVFAHHIAHDTPSGVSEVEVVGIVVVQVTFVTIVLVDVAHDGVLQGFHRALRLHDLILCGRRRLGKSLFDATVQADCHEQYAAGKGFRDQSYLFHCDHPFLLIYMGEDRLRIAG